jgi:hypothetical protein
MQLTMPVRNHENITPVKQSQAMTIVLGDAHRVYYYFGLNDPADPTVPKPTLHTTDFSARGIRQVLLARRRAQPGQPLMLLLKAGPKAHYQDMVDILDEMNITDQKKYALVDLAAADRQLLPAAER